MADNGFDWEKHTIEWLKREKVQQFQLEWQQSQHTQYFTFKQILADRQDKFPTVINDVINEYIDNHLPIYLLDLKNMHLVHRSNVKQPLESNTTKYIESCIQQAIIQPDPQVLSALGRTTKEWIREKTSYAIFSHRWLGKDELIFQDISKFPKLSAGGFHKLVNKSNRTLHGGADILDQVISLTVNADNTPDYPLLDAMEELCQSFSAQERKDCQGFVKLVKFCRIASLHGCHYVWFDTGCINKSSSAELEESIRSMFNWYRNSQICIVHLANTEDIFSLQEDPWFTRGWTLQELLAPKRVKFYGKSWQPLIINSSDNDKDSNLEHPLWDHICNITNISHEKIRNFEPGIHHARDALVWLSKRRTTRIEDMAYCLIGLLRIPLSIAYGEGEMAFYRLQAEILQRTPNMGLFVWQGQSSIENSMLAAGPDCFSSLALQPLSSSTPEDKVDRSYSLTNYGLRILLSVYRMPSGTWSVDGSRLGEPKIILKMSEFRHMTVKLWSLEEYESVELAVLGMVEDESSGQKNSLAILLGFKDGHWKRIAKEHIALSVPIETVLQTRFIR